MEARRRVEFTDVELAGGAKLAAPVEKAVAGPVEKAAAGPCVGEARGTREAPWASGYKKIWNRLIHQIR